MPTCVQEVALKPNFLISNDAKSMDFIDVFQLKSQMLKTKPLPREMMVAFFRSFPPIFILLLKIRESFAKAFGLKTAPETTAEGREIALQNFKGDVGESLAVFEVLAKNDVEMLTGQKDNHLDFKLSFISYTDVQPILEIATTVKLNNALGRVYFRVVKPFHKFFVKRILIRMEKYLATIQYA